MNKLLLQRSKMSGRSPRYAWLLSWSLWTALLCLKNFLQRALRLKTSRLRLAAGTQQKKRASPRHDKQRSPACRQTGLRAADGGLDASQQRSVQSTVQHSIATNTEYSCPAMTFMQEPADRHGTCTCSPAALPETAGSSTCTPASSVADSSDVGTPPGSVCGDSLCDDVPDLPGPKASLQRPRSQSSLRSPKTVTFAPHPIICSPPTEAALRRLNASHTPNKHHAPSSSTHRRSSTSSSSTAAACPSPSPSPSPPTPQPTPPPLSPHPTPLPTHTSSVASYTPSLTPLHMHLHARPYGTNGRGRARAALEEAKRRHAHLGREPVHPDSWPAAPPPADEPSRPTSSWHEYQQQQQLLQQQQMLLQGEAHRLTPNLPLAASDAGMLCVGYAARGRQQQQQEERRGGEVQQQQQQREQQEQRGRQPLSMAARCSAAGGGRGLLLGNPMACANSLVKQQY